MNNVTFILRDSNLECRDYHKQTFYNSTCTFMKEVDDCQISDGFLNYLIVTFCNFDDKQTGLAVFLLFVWLFILFIGLGVTADSFFCPSLRVIADSLSISQNVAGVTFLAFGNGAPDVFSAIAAIGNAKDGDAGLAFGALFGAGIFVSTVVAGTICIIKPFTSVQRPLLRDLIFFMIAGFWAFVVIWDGYISLLETLGFLFLYGVYIIVVVFGRYFNQRIKQWRNGGVLIRKNEFSSTNVSTSVNTMLVPDEGDQEANESEPLLVTISSNSEYLRSTDIKEGIKPFTKQEWHTSNWFFKLFLIVKTPVLYLLKLTIPLVDYEVTNDNWNKFVIILNCVTAPIFMAFATKIAFNKIGTLPVWGLALVISAVLTTLVLVFTTWQQKPKYHWLFSYLGFLVSVVWIYTIANEIVNVLTAFGVILDISNTILGLTFLAWGNSLSDFVADVVSARQGYPNMGIAACFGGPLFNILLGVGIPFTVKCIKLKGGFHIKTSLLQDVLALFMGLSLVTTLIFIPLNKFNFSKRYGFFLLAFYAIALTFCILIEAGVIGLNN